MQRWKGMARTGRPTEEPKSEKIILRMTYRMRKSLEKQALRADIPLSEYVRQLLEWAIENKNT